MLSAVREAVEGLAKLCNSMIKHCYIFMMYMGQTFNALLPSVFAISNTTISMFYIFAAIEWWIYSHSVAEIEGF